jgi:hypothetical protein
MVALFVLTILYTNTVESRAVHQNYQGIPTSQLHHIRIFDGRNNNEEHQNEGDQDEYVHAKRKSDFLLSLYGLPYTLVNKRAVN